MSRGDPGLHTEPLQIFLRPCEVAALRYLCWATRGRSLGPDERLTPAEFAAQCVQVVIVEKLPGFGLSLSDFKGSDTPAQHLMEAQR